MFSDVHQLSGIDRLHSLNKTNQTIGFSCRTSIPMTDPWCYIWCAMDPINKNPLSVSINIPAPAGSVMAQIADDEDVAELRDGDELQVGDVLPQIQMVMTTTTGDG